MWLRNDIDQTKEYSLALCQKPDGARSFALWVAGTPTPPLAVLLTETVPLDLLLRRDVIRISEVVKLSSGVPFFVDSHGRWLTNAEWNALNGDFASVPWLNGLKPRFAPQ
jgi:hypothetical protein